MQPGTGHMAWQATFLILPGIPAELKYLRDIAERDTINRYTTAEITVEQTNHNTINSSADLDGIVDGLVDGVNEAIDIVTEGVHT